MVTRFFNRVKVGVANGGNGNLTLGAAVTGFQSFAQAGVPNNAVVSYVIEDGAAWEYGHGTYVSSGTVFKRTTMLASSLGSTPINASNNAVVYITMLADDVPQAVPGGGTTGQALTKKSNIDGDVQWSDVASGGGGGGGGGSVLPPTIVQQATKTTFGTQGYGVDFSTTPVQGNLLVFFCIGTGGGASAASGYTMLASRTTTDVEYLLTRKAGANEPTNQLPLTGDFSRMVVCGYEIVGASAVDFTSNAIFVAPADTTSTNVSVTLPAVPASSIVLGAFLANRDESYTLGGSVTPDQGYHGPIDGSGTYVVLAPFHEVTTTSGDVTLTATGSNANVRNIFAFAARAGAFSGTLVSLSDVDDTTPPTDGQVPAWNAASSKFKFATPASGGAGGAPVANPPRAFRVQVLGDPPYYGWSINEIVILDKSGTVIPIPTGSTFSDNGHADANDASKAFDGDTTTFWSNGAKGYIQVVFPALLTKAIASIKMMGRQTGNGISAQTPTAFKLLLSADGASFFDAAETDATWTDTDTYKTFAVANTLGVSGGSSPDRVAAMVAVQASTSASNGADGAAMTILHKKNIASVTRLQSSVYRIKFTTPIPQHCMPIMACILGTGGNIAATNMAVERVNNVYDDDGNMTMTTEIVIRMNWDHGSYQGFDVFKFWLKMEDLSIGADS